MNIYSNSWPEEQQHLQRHQDLIREAEQCRLIQRARGEDVETERAPRSRWAWLVSIRSWLATLFEHRPSRIPADPSKAVPSNCSR